MIYRAHAWIEGAAVLAARLATCAQCGCLRVAEGGAVRFILRGLEEPERVQDSEPRCETTARPARRAW